MNGVAQWVVIGFGITVAVTGLLLLLFRQEEGSNRLKLFGQEIEVSKPGLLVLLIGSIVALAPLIIPQVTNDKGETRAEKSGTETDLDTDKIAHDIRLSVKPIKMSVDECVDKGKKALEDSNFTGITATELLAYGYSKEYTGVVWCNSSNEMVLFVVSGPDWQIAETKRVNLERGF